MFGISAAADPEHGFAVVRDESTFGISPKQMQEPNPITRGVNEFDKFRQTPRGVWYPTRRRNRQFRRETWKSIPDRNINSPSTSRPTFPISCSRPPTTND